MAGRRALVEAAGEVVELPDGDLLSGSIDPFITKPDATLTYTGSRLTGVAYADGTSKVLTYTGNQLTQVVGTNLRGETVTKTLSYTGNRLTGVTTVVS